MINDISGKLIQLFNSYPDVTKDELASLYDENAVFEDPVTRVQGLCNINTYFQKLYRGVTSCHFDCIDEDHTDSHAVISWIMTIRHRALNRGKPVTVHGCSLITCHDKIISHRDYFDLGEMLYENISVLGSVIRYIKNRIHK